MVNSHAAIFMSQKHRIVDKKTGLTVTFETEGPPEWGDNMPNPDMETLTEEKTVLEPEIVKEDGYFQVEVTLCMSLGERVTYNNVVTYTLLSSPTRMLAMLLHDEDSVTGSRLVLINLDRIDSIDSPYAPDTWENLLKFTEKP